MTRIRRRSSDWHPPRAHAAVCFFLLLIYLAVLSYGASRLVGWVASGAWA